MSKNNGFTFIEVLISMSLLTIFMLSIFNLQLKALELSKEMLMQTIAITQIKSIVSIMQMSISNFGDFYSDWNKKNHDLLPNGKGEIVKYADHYVFRLRWKSHISYDWYCSSKKIPNYACVELKVLK